MNAIHKILSINEKELSLNVSDQASWHADYSDTSYIYIGNLHDSIAEKDILAIFSQYGNPTHIDLVKDRESGRSRGFCYLKYEDQRSCVLAIDNFNGTLIYGKALKVDHTYYKLAKGKREDDFRVVYPDARQAPKPKSIENAPRLLPYKSARKQDSSEKNTEPASQATRGGSHHKSASPDACSELADNGFSDPMASFKNDNDFSDPMASFKNDNDFSDPMASFKDTIPKLPSAAVSGLESAVHNQNRASSRLGSGRDKKRSHREHRHDSKRHHGSTESGPADKT